MHQTFGGSAQERQSLRRRTGGRQMAERPCDAAGQQALPDGTLLIYTHDQVPLLYGVYEVQWE